MRILKKLMLGLAAVVAVAALLVAIESFGGHPMGLFAGKRPDNLGFANARFAPPSWKPNCVSSTVEKTDKHYIEPITYTGDREAAWKRLTAIVKSQPRASVVKEAPGYLYAEFKSAGMGFIDDVEFALDERAGLIQVRSASRLGVRDFGLNRKRIEAIRAAFAA
jgi:uncharacterized protein (DUF1499 family)